MPEFADICARLDDGRLLEITDWSLSSQQTWAVIGTNGSGKTALSCLFSNALTLSRGQVSGLPDLVEYVSLEAQIALLDRERAEDESDLLDCTDVGTLVRDLLFPLGEWERWLAPLNMTHLMDQGFRSLSTGESRKVLLLYALKQQPELLVLDEPLEGLDASSREAALSLLSQSHAAGQCIVWVSNRKEELPDWITHLAFMHDAKLLVQGEKDAVLNTPEIQHLLYFDQELAEFPEAPVNYVLNTDDPLVRLQNGSISYGEKVLFSGLNWQVESGQHWAISGANGSGKTSLLQMIMGDNPQCYRNDLFLFGMQRGSGETIWDIKKHIGLVSSSLQLEYRATTNVLTAVISGLYDSIGLYQAAGDQDRHQAEQWLSIIGLQDKANLSLHHLSYGEKRLVLFARALIKQPPLLILDEPCQGLDEPSRAMVLAFINKLAEQQKITLLYVTHHADEIPEAINNRLELGVNNESGYKSHMT